LTACQKNIEIFIVIFITIAILSKIIIMIWINILIMAEKKTNLFDDILFSIPENAATKLK
jgi:hypothetical protein